MKTLHSIWRDERIVPIKLTQLTPMSLHLDERWATRDLPRVQKDGLMYPIAVYKTTVDWWNNKFTKWRPLNCRYVDPIENDDGFVWAIKVGSNRYQCAEFMGFDSIDAIMFENSDEAAKFGIWVRETNPLITNRRYEGLWSYE